MTTFSAEFKQMLDNDDLINKSWNRWKKLQPWYVRIFMSRTKAYTDGFTVGFLSAAGIMDEVSSNAIHSE